MFSPSPPALPLLHTKTSFHSCTMFFAASFVSAALAVLSISVSAIPTEDLSARAVCPAGQFPDSTAAVPGTCTPCPAGNTCDGSSNVQPCDYGRYQPTPGSTTCLPTPAGSYQPQRGQTVALPCYVGSYQPYPGQAFCYGAPSGRFQGQYVSSLSCMHMSILLIGAQYRPGGCVRRVLRLGGYSVEL
ncbi:hypothetical protein B0H15DRAFT_1023340 [Mycena belliarum]|uniref:Uncharacterized protein n=1 Tax=Mycena belliarum TaxID=1033014 RepID=A0AAD6XT98_9AGAR|nr:hypothetical protein B0H15DRAFT_1023340 [Mycena belliae]